MDDASNNPSFNRAYVNLYSAYVHKTLSLSFIIEYICAMFGFGCYFVEKVTLIIKLNRLSVCMSDLSDVTYTEYWD